MRVTLLCQLLCIAMLAVDASAGEAPARVGFGEPVARAADLRAATVTLARRARRP